MPTLEQEIDRVGSRLREGLTAVIDGIPGSPRGPQAVAAALGLDKVLASRVMKAARARDPIAVVHAVPGPEPVRRLLEAAQKRGVDEGRIEEARGAVDALAEIIRREVGDRSALDALLSAWLPSARREFELRRKQSVFKSMSQLKGVEAAVNLATVFLHPGADAERIDVVWLMGHFGLHRLRPGASARFATVKLDDPSRSRKPVALDGAEIDSIHDALLPEFCSPREIPVAVSRAGQAMHYTLGGDALGPKRTIDFVTAEVNRDELPRTVPAGSGRRGYVFATISIPVRTLLFDVVVHESIYCGRDPQLLLYDTAVDGVASVNDRSRDISRLDLQEFVKSLGRGAGALRSERVPNYLEMVRRVFASLKWDDASFRTYRCEIDYPLYGEQVVMAFDAEARARIMHEANRPADDPDA